MKNLQKITYKVSFINGAFHVLVGGLKNGVVTLVSSAPGFYYALKDGKCYNSDTKTREWKGVDDYIKNGRPDIYKVLTQGQILGALSRCRWK